MIDQDVEISIHQQYDIVSERGTIKEDRLWLLVEGKTGQCRLYHNQGIADVLNVQDAAHKRRLVRTLVEDL
jgi:hypothetical protein